MGTCLVTRHGIEPVKDMGNTKNDEILVRSLNALCKHNSQEWNSRKSPVVYCLYIAAVWSTGKSKEALPNYRVTRPAFHQTLELEHQQRSSYCYLCPVLVSDLLILYYMSNQMIC